MSPMTDPLTEQAAHMTGTTLKQAVHVSVGGRRLRVRLSNAFGRTELVVSSAEIARSSDGSALGATDPVALRFLGSPGVVVAPGGIAYSDPLEFPLQAL